MLPGNTPSLIDKLSAENDVGTRVQIDFFKLRSFFESSSSPETKK